MNTQQLLCFLQVADNLNFTRAAEELFITPPAVTHQINALETELDTKLFIRTKKSVELTPAGMGFYEDAKDILGKTIAAKQRIKDQTLRASRVLSIGCCNEAEMQLFPGILSVYRIKQPNVHPLIRIIPPKQMVHVFSNHNLDLIFCVKNALTNVADYEFAELFSDDLVCVLPNTHAYSQKEKLSFDDLANQTIILGNPQTLPGRMTDHIQDTLHFKNITPYYCDSSSTSNILVSAGYGIALMPRSHAPHTDALTIVSLTPSHSLPYGIAYHKKIATPEMRDFLAIAKETYQLAFPKANE